MRHDVILLREAALVPNYTAYTTHRILVQHPVAQFKGYKNRDYSQYESNGAASTELVPEKTDYKAKYESAPKIELNFDDFFAEETPAEKAAAEKAAKAEAANAERKAEADAKEAEAAARLKADTEMRKASKVRVILLLFVSVACERSVGDLLRGFAYFM